MQQWQRDTRFTSSVSDIVMHPAYQRIIGLGPRVLPLIFTELSKAPGHWFWALRSIVGTDVAKDTRTIEDATGEWLAWAREHNYL